MRKDYITRIKANVSIYATKKTGNILDGTYTSVFMGRSMNFEDLREYVPGDNVKDIDWKASSRSGQVLVKRFVAEKKHNIVFVTDTGVKMLADTPLNKSKKEIALYTMGTIGYLAYKNGDTVGALYNKDGKICYHPCKSGLTNVEKILAYYDADAAVGRENNIEKTLNFIVNNMKNRMIIFLITDKRGMNSISDECLKRVKCRHDLLYINLGDAEITDTKEQKLQRKLFAKLKGKSSSETQAAAKTFDMDADCYVPEYVSGNKKLRQLELELNESISEENRRKTIKYGIMNVEINDEGEIVGKVIELLDKHKHANIR